MNPEIKTAKNLYLWLWLSPIFTYPSYVLLLLVMISTFEVMARAQGRVPVPVMIIAVLASGLWHLCLLIPAISGKSEFVRWHGRQALLIAGVRTAAAVIIFGFTQGEFWGELVMIGIWLSSNLWGQGQAKRGDCSLMRWRGLGTALPLPAAEQPAEKKFASAPAIMQDNLDDVDFLVETIRFNPDPEKRRLALARLENLDMVESL